VSCTASAPQQAVIPAHAGIQYSEASRFHHQRSGILDHPLSRMMTKVSVIASEAKRSNPLLLICCLMDCFASLAMTMKRSFAISPRDAPEFCSDVPPSEIRGRRECRAPDAPAASRVEKNTRVSHHGHAGSPGIPRAMVLTAYFALSPVTGLCCHRRPQIESANLTPASGRQDHTTLPSARNVIRLLTCRVHRIPCPTSVTIAKRPSVWAGIAKM
jgi:hypothetical protein